MKKLKKVYIEISNLCNLQCSFCPEVLRPKKIMAPNSFETIVEKVKDHAEEVCLHLMGEPLLHPQFSEIVKHCEDNNVLINLTSNGILLDRYKKLLFNSKALRQINFSIQSFKDNFPQKELTPYLDGLMLFIKELHELRPEVYVNLRLWNLGDKAFENEEVIQFLEKEFETTINRVVDVASIKSKRIWNKVYLHFDSRFDWPSFYLPPQGDKGKCHGLKSHIGVHADGTVVPCCLDKEAVINLGNLTEQSLEEILMSKRAQTMLNGFNQGKRVEKLCQHCTFINRF